MSETSKCRQSLAPYCKGLGLDVGFGGDPINESAICVDLAQPYTSLGNRQVQVAIKHPCEIEQVFRPYCLDYIYTSHLLEDFSYMDNQLIMRSWQRLLKDGGFIVINCPDQQVYLEFCRSTGSGANTHHIEKDFSLDNYKANCLHKSLKVFHENKLTNDYSFELVLQKAL